LRNFLQANIVYCKKHISQKTFCKASNSMIYKLVSSSHKTQRSLFCNKKKQKTKKS